MTEFLSEVWVWALGIIGGISITAIITAIICGCLKGAFSKVIAKIDTKKLADRAVDEGIAKVKKIAFTHNIQPLVESGMEKVYENMNQKLTEALAKLYKKQDKMINIMEKFYAYFDNSMVADETKKALKDAIAEAKDERVEIDSVVVEETIEPEEKSIVAPVEAVKTHAKVER